MKLTFYNHYGVGDLFESREFVLDWMRLCGVTEATYACRFPAVFEDLPQLTCSPVQPDMDMRKAWRRDGDHLFINTWIGCRNASTNPKGDYVLWPGVGCTVENIYRMHQDYLREAGLPPLPRSIVEYIPTIDYTRVHLVARCHKFISEQRGKRLVLLCNGATGSGHAVNFDFAAMVRMLPSKLYEGICFIFTEWRDLDLDCYFTDGITGRATSGSGVSDILAISYLSQFCSVIVGRCSGAQMPTETLVNWMDSRKTFLSFTAHDNGATYVRDPVPLGLKAKRVWSGAQTPEEAAKVLCEVLK